MMKWDPETWPRWLRWIAFLPLAVAAYFFFYSGIGFVVMLLNWEGLGAFLVHTTIAGMAACAMVFTAGYVSPRGRFGVALAVAIFLVGMTIYAFITAGFYRASWLYWLDLAATIIGAAAGAGSVLRELD